MMDGGQPQDDPAQTPVVVHDEQGEHHGEVEVHLDGPTAEDTEERSRSRW